MRPQDHEFEPRHHPNTVVFKNRALLHAKYGRGPKTFFTVYITQRALVVNMRPEDHEFEPYHHPNTVVFKNRALLHAKYGRGSKAHYYGWRGIQEIFPFLDRDQCRGNLVLGTLTLTSLAPLMIY